MGTMDMHMGMNALYSHGSRPHQLQSPLNSQLLWDLGHFGQVQPSTECF